MSKTLAASLEAPANAREPIGFVLRERLPDCGVNYSDTHLRRLEEAGKFPKRVLMGENRIAYIASEIRDYQNKRIALRDAAASAAPELSDPEPEPAPERAAPKRKPSKKGMKPKGKPGRARPRRVVRFEEADDAQPAP
jgi:prophage regulatory protein